MTKFADERRSCEVPASVAEWSRRQVPRTTLIGPGYDRTTYGHYRVAGARPTTAQRILDVAAGLPDGARIAGWAAAYVHGADLLDGLDDVTMKPLPVPVLLAPGQRRRSVEGILYRQSTRLARGTVVGDVAVTHPAAQCVGPGTAGPGPHREERLERAGLVVVRVEKADLTDHRPQLAERLRLARESGLRRDRSLDRWTVDEPEHWIGLPA